MEVACPLKSAASGQPFDFKIFAKNMGDYYEDVDLTWWVEDSIGQKYGVSSSPVAIRPENDFEKPASVFIPLDVAKGQYNAKARLRLKTLEANASCAFVLSTPEEYFSTTLADISSRLDALEKRIDEKTSSGYRTDMLLQKLERARAKLAILQGSAANNNFTNLNVGVTDVLGDISDLSYDIDALEKTANIDSTVLVTILGTAAAIVFIMVISYSLHQRGKRRGSVLRSTGTTLEQKLEHILGLEE